MEIQKNWQTTLSPFVGAIVSFAVLFVLFSRQDLVAMRAAAMAVSPGLLLVALAALIASVVLATWRLRLLVEDTGYRVSFAAAMSAVCLGQLAGAVLFQIFGQLLMRGALLRRSGISLSASVLVTLYERIMALAVLTLFATLGALKIFGVVELDFVRGGADFVVLAIGVVVVTAVAAALAWGERLAKACASLTAGVAGRVVRNAAITVGIQLSTLLAFVAVAIAVWPDASVVNVTAASAIVMFASALPVSMAGWGVRELTAMFALGAIGFAPSAAVLSGFLIGVMSLMINAVLGMVASTQPNHTIAPNETLKPRDFAAAALGWIVPLAAAMAVFFQVHVPVTGLTVNVNFADPLVIVGGGLFLIQAIYDRPVWRLPHFSLYLVLMSLAIVLAFIHGYFSFGWSQWAGMNKLFGWWILLCYAFTGAMVVQSAGEEGRTTILRTIVAAACALVAMEISIDIIRLNGIHTFGDALRLKGFAQDSNAFAFQLLLAAAILLAQIGHWRPAKLLLSLLIVGLWLTGSRSGMIAFVAMLAAYVLLVRSKALVAAPYVLGGIVAALVWHFVLIKAGSILVSIGFDSTYLASGQSAKGPLLDQLFGEYRPLSTVDHIRTVAIGLEQFMSSPIWGNGLGYFIEGYGRQFGISHPIDSTAVWLLAEFGLLGFAIFVFPFTRILIINWSEADAGSALALNTVIVLVAFATMSMFYELLYQRLFWLLLGVLLLSAPPAKR